MYHAQHLQTQQLQPPNQQHTSQQQQDQVRWKVKSTFNVLALFLSSTHCFSPTHLKHAPFYERFLWVMLMSVPLFILLTLHLLPKTLSESLYNGGVIRCELLQQSTERPMQPAVAFPHACPRHKLGKMATYSQFVLLLIFPRPHRARVYLSPVRTHARIIIIALFDEDHHCLLHTPTPPCGPRFLPRTEVSGKKNTKNPPELCLARTGTNPKSAGSPPRPDRLGRRQISSTPSGSLAPPAMRLCLREQHSSLRRGMVL